MHVLPDLKRLEEKYGDALVVIGVHSAKFTNERDPDNLRHIIVRYDISHPVANDANFAIWKAYTARAWPTLVLIDPEGYIVAAASGEGHADAFDRAVAAVIAVFDERGLIDRTPLAASPERARLAQSTLAFPGKVLADATGARLFVADSNHHRVLVCALDGRVMDVIGSGRAGRTDGVFDDARFYRPQGMALDAGAGRDVLYVADTENHVVRAVDLTARTVATLAGTGAQAAWGGQGGAAREVPLSSPWDVALVDRLLFVANAGTHQIWVIDLDRRLALPYAGSGREARVDGAIDDAAFAQPSGLTIDGRTLYVADAEANIIRAIALPPANTVRTIAGGDLFEFGDLDGAGDAARFQHPLGVAADAGRVFVADTYNHRIRVLDPVTRRVAGYAGAGTAGMADGPAAAARFHEPGGLSVAPGAIYVADTNNHRIRRIDMTTDRVETVAVAFPG
jgi:DNA-binding beta-propeller fold protein YncE